MERLFAFFVLLLFALGIPGMIFMLRLRPDKSKWIAGFLGLLFIGCITSGLVYLLARNTGEAAAFWYWPYMFFINIFGILVNIGYRAYLRMSAKSANKAVSVFLWVCYVLCMLSDPFVVAGFIAKWM